ncbi:MAG: MASE1 domain-containing protein [Alphaproteobacteria bacterium]|nr:MASE1 domain-containing protein [Alphaproteobacteria bacterium]
MLPLLPPHDPFEKPLDLRLTASTGKLRLAVILFIVAGLYIISAKLGLSLALTAKQVTLAWPPTGIALAALLLSGYRVLPAIFLGAFLANVTAAEPVLTALGIGVGNTLEALFGAWALQRFVGFRNDLNRQRDVLGLILFSAVLSTMIGATLGVTSLCLGGVQKWALFLPLWRDWWLGDAAGALIVAPLLLVWLNRPCPRLRPGMLLEGPLLLGALAAAYAGIFMGLREAHSEWKFIIFPFTIWAALRFGQCGTTLVTFIASALAIWALTGGAGSFGSALLGENLLVLQIFMMIVAATGLFLGAIIAERGETEKKLQATHQYLKNMLDNIPDPIFMKDKQHRWIDGNKSFWDLMHGPPEKFLGKSDYEFFPKEEADVFWEKDNKVFDSGEVDVNEESFTDFRGERHILSTKKVAFRNEEGEPFLVGVIRDITDLKKTEAQLLKYTKELERSNQELEDFAHIASHDLKEPLRGLNIQSGFLMEDFKDKLGPEGLRRLTRLTQLSQRMERLVNDLLHFSGLGRTEMAVQEVDPNILVRDVQQMMETFLSEHKARIVMPQPLPKIVCDKTKITEVFRNLITNAVKYNDKPKPLVEVGFLDAVETPQGQEHGVFYVRDNGIGIENRHHQEIFRIFRRIATPDGERETGTGMGLSFVKKIVERHGGRIWVESAPGKGTTFYFILHPKGGVHE